MITFFLLILTSCTYVNLKPVDYKPVLQIKSKIFPLESIPVYKNKQTSPLYVQNGQFIKKGEKISKNIKAITSGFIELVNNNSNYLAFIHNYSKIKIPVYPDNESYALYEQVTDCLFTYNNIKRSCSLNKTLNNFIIYVENINNKITPNKNSMATINLTVPIQKNVHIFLKKDIARNRFIILDTQEEKIKFYLSRYTKDAKHFIVYEKLP